MRLRLGIDVGGTFTDLYAQSEEDGSVSTLKLHSSPDDPSTAIIRGVQTLLAQCRLGPDDVSYLSHSSTVATNTILQHVGARVGMVTTAGFRDLLEIGRQKRPSVFDLFADKAPVLVPRFLRREVRERVGHDGSVLMPLNGDELQETMDALAADGIESLAVCFLNSYANPRHELTAKGLAERLKPGLYVSASHELTGEFREYERFLTAVLNAYIGPVLQDYLRHFRSRLRELGVRTEPHIIQSNGGLLSVDSAMSSPVRTVLSGPSAGVAGAAHVAREAGIPDVITLDMGGTSTDVSLMRDAQPSLRSGLTVGGYQIRVPAIAIHTIGAGGGSIAWVDETLGFHVGPRSAGAVPGPAAYGLGGVQPTVTDANVVLGRLNPDVLLGGAVPIQRHLAERAVASLAQKLGLSLERTASGILDIAVSNMVRAVRVISVEQGEDPREFALMAFGGAGPLHASAIARQLDIRRMLIPAAPGLLCAVGALLSEPRMEYSRTRVLTLDGDQSPIDRELGELEAQAIDWMEAEGLDPEHRLLSYSVDLRYLGQNYELTVGLPGRLGDGVAVQALAERFHALHRKHYGYTSPGHPIQLVTCRVVGAGRVERLPAPRRTLGGGTPGTGATRPVYFETTGRWETCPVYWRDHLGAGAVLSGPAVIEQVDSTVVLYPGDQARVDELGHMIVEVPADVV